MAGDGALWALVGFLGTLLLVGIVANLAIGLDIRLRLTKEETTTRRKLRSSPGDPSEVVEDE